MTCADVQTIQAGNGVTDRFSFDFPYIFKSEIHVYLWNTTTKEWDEKLTTDATYPWQITDANPTIVEFTGTVPPSPTTPTDPNEPTVDNVRIRRITNVDDIRALFNPGSAIRSDDLNKNFEQLRFAIQEANCQGIPDDVDEYLKNYYWNKFDSTVYSTETWDSDDDQVATTQAIDARIDSKIDSALTVDIIGADGVNVQDDTPSAGQITVGLSAGSVDLDRIKAEDIITQAEQDANYALTGDDNSIFTSSAAVRRFENYVQNSTPSTTGIGKGRVWVDVDDDLTLSVWDGSAWLGITSGGTFTNQPRVVYVDAASGSDSNDGHRISRPKATIKAAINQINADADYGDGSVVIVAAGVYQEAAPIQIQKKNVSIIGQALRSCIVHPTVATQGDQSAGNHALFELNSGSYIANLTLTGMKANTGTGNSVDSTLPTNQGWNFKFLSGASITKSPYIQNCTNFSDSEIDNSNLNATTPAGGLAGDTDSAPTGGGLLVDGSAVDSASKLRSMVCDSYTHVGLNGPGILVTNNGYVQATSSYAFFNKYHIKTLNGGQANLAASTTDFGNQGLVADGKSSAAIFTSNVDGAANDGDITFNINEPTKGAGWFGNTERPATNMLVEVNSVIYPILAATANTDSEGGAGWTVTISRPDPNNKSSNLGLNGAVSDNAAVSFFLRSMIASSGHTMEYVGSGTDYSALPENGGVPDETQQIIESNNGKVWTAITDHNGKFKIGGNQTDEPIFEVDQQLGFVSIPEGSIAFNLLSDQTPQLGGNLDVNGNTITGLTASPTAADEATSKAYVDAQIAGIDEVVEDTTPQLGGDLDANGHDIILDTGAAATPSLTFTGDTNTGIYSPGADQVAISTNGTGRLFIDASGRVGIGAASAGPILYGKGSSGYTTVDFDSTGATGGTVLRAFQNGTVKSAFGVTGWFLSDTSADTALMAYSGQGMRFYTNGANERLRITSTGQLSHIGGGTSGSPAVGFNGSAPSNSLIIDSSGKVGLGTSSPSTSALLDVADRIAVAEGSAATPSLHSRTDTNTGVNLVGTDRLSLVTAGSNRLFIDASGNVGVGTTSAAATLHSRSDNAGSGSTPLLIQNRSISANTAVGISFAPNTSDTADRSAVIYGVNSSGGSGNATDLTFHTNANGASPTEKARIDSSGNVGIGTTSPDALLHLSKALTNGETIFRIQPTSFSAGFSVNQAFTRGSTDLVRFTVASDAINADKGSLTISTSSTTSTTNPVATFTGDGKVGIGTTSPLVNLDIVGSANRLLFDTDAATPEIKATNAAGSSYVLTRYNAAEHRFDIANSEKARIDSSGRLLVGTTSHSEIGGASGRIEVIGAINLRTTDSSVVNGDAVGILRFIGDDSSVTQGAEIAAYGDGTWNPGASSAPTRLVFSTTSNTATTPTERMRITNAGKVIIGDIGYGQPDRVQIYGTDVSNGYCILTNVAGTGTRYHIRFENGNGIVGSITTSGTTTAYNETSDYRLKENVVPLTGAIDRLNQLQVRRFNFIADPDTTFDGFIAHEAQEVVPESVTGEKDAVDENGNPQYQGIDKSKMVPLLTAALQEALAEIESLKARVTALEP